MAGTFARHTIGWSNAITETPLRSPFSTFAFETVRLFEDARRRRALANATGHLAGALLAVGLGTLVVSVLVG